MSLSRWRIDPWELPLFVYTIRVGHLSQEIDGCWAILDIRSLYLAQYPEKLPSDIVQEALRFHMFE